jgi:hypothetical protein
LTAEASQKCTYFFAIFLLLLNEFVIAKNRLLRAPKDLREDHHRQKKGFRVVDASSKLQSAHGLHINAAVTMCDNIFVII